MTLSESAPACSTTNKIWDQMPVTEPSRAVFLSYASQDAEAAQLVTRTRMAPAALRSLSVVFLDELSTADYAGRAVKGRRCDHVWPADSRCLEVLDIMPSFSFLGLNCHQFALESRCFSAPNTSASATKTPPITQRWLNQSVSIRARCGSNREYAMGTASPVANRTIDC